MTSFPPGFCFQLCRTAHNEAHMAPWDVYDGVASRERNGIGSEHKRTSHGPLGSHQSHLIHMQA